MNKIDEQIYFLRFLFDETSEDGKKCDEIIDTLKALRAEVAALKAEVARCHEIYREALAAKAKPRRKVVQLIVVPQEGQWNELYALADDGTIWQRYEPQAWSQALGIPQPEQEEQR